MATVSRYLLFNKPYQVLCQFSPEAGKKTLADFIDVPHVYPAGRLDFDSEGLVLLTSDGRLQHQMTDPKFGHARTYWVQVEGAITEAALEQLRNGVVLEGRQTLAAKAEVITEPDFPPRTPPVRLRKSIPTSWIALTLREGRNRQVRHMTAAAGYPTLRLIRTAMGSLTLARLTPGEWRDLTEPEIQALRANSRTGKWRANAAARQRRD